MSDSATTGADNSTGPSKIKGWLAEVNLYERETEKWRKRSDKIVRRYKDERSPREEKLGRFNILWSNVQTLLPTLYARNPKPDVQRRFKDADPVGRVASDVLERSLTFYCDTERFGETARQSVLDYLLAGRGTLWVRYCAEFETKAKDEKKDEDGEEVTDDEDQEYLTSEDVEVDFVHREDFGHNIARTWEEVWLVWRVVYLTRDECVKRFGDAGKTVPLDRKGEQKRGERGNTGAESDDAVEAKASIYEAWDKKKQCAVWFHKDCPEALDERPDPLKLEHFFPCPRPIIANNANDSIIPVPDYTQYQDQAIELDNVTSRIEAIEKGIKVAGTYDASCPGLDRMFAEGIDVQMIPVQTWAQFAEKGGLKGAMDLLDVKPYVDAITALYETRQQVKNDLYEITGIADIIRGSSEAEETATAQEIKSQFATTRISDRQRDVQRFIRETIRLMADVICGHFQPETIKEISGVRLFTQQEKAAIKANPQAAQQLIQQTGLTPDQVETMMADPSWEEVFALIKNKPLRTFRVDIETDSIIKADEEADKASRIEFLKAAGAFLQQATEIGGQQPQAIPLMAQMLMFGVRAFPIGKELEGAFNAFIQKMEKAAASNQQPPNPEMAKVQAEAQANQQKLGQEFQLEQMRIKAKEQLDQAEQQARVAADQQEAATKAQQSMEELKQTAQTEILKAHIQAATAIEVARIGKQMDTGDSAEAREAGAEGLGAQQQPRPQPSPLAQPGAPLPPWLHQALANGAGNVPAAQPNGALTLRR